MFENIDYADKDKFTMQYDPKLKSEDTKRLLELIVDNLIDGYSTSTISHNLCKELGFRAIYAKALVAKAYKDYMNMSKKGSENLKEKNISRLNRIFRQAMEKGDRKSALQAVDLLNKMNNYYTSKVEVTSKEFEIRLDGEN